MSKVISAIFEDADAADFALADLRRGGLLVEAYRIQPLYRRNRESLTQDTGAYVNMAGAPVTALVFDNSIASVPEATRREDVNNREVVMLVTVADHRAADAQSLLVSSKGRQVHTVGN